MTVNTMTQEALNTYNEAYYYYTGSNGYPLNYHKAIEKFNHAAQLGVSQAMNYLGIIYLEGKFVEQNYALAADWFLKAAQAEPVDIHSMYNLGRMYYNGWGVEKNYETAKDFLERTLSACKSTASPYPQSCYLLGVIYFEVYKNYNKAHLHFREAALKGNIPDAWYYLGWLLERHLMPSSISNLPKEDRTLERNKLARNYYEKAANLGCAPAMDSLGRLHIMYQNNAVGIGWLEKAAALGYEPSQKRLRLLKAADSGSLLKMGSSLIDMFKKS